MINIIKKYNIFVFSFLILVGGAYFCVQIKNTQLKKTHINFDKIFDSIRFNIMSDSEYAKNPATYKYKMPQKIHDILFFNAADNNYNLANDVMKTSVSKTLQANYIRKKRINKKQLITQIPSGKVSDNTSLKIDGKAGEILFISNAQNNKNCAIDDLKSNYVYKNWQIDAMLQDVLRRIPSGKISDKLSLANNKYSAIDELKQNYVYKNWQLDDMWYDISRKIPTGQITANEKILNEKIISEKVLGEKVSLQQQEIFGYNKIGDGIAWNNFSKLHVNYIEKVKNNKKK